MDSTNIWWADPESWIKELQAWSSLTVCLNSSPHREDQISFCFFAYDIHNSGYITRSSFTNSWLSKSWLARGLGLRCNLVKTLHWILIARDDMMSHLKDCLVESPSLSGNADGENEVEGVKVKIQKIRHWANFAKHWRDIDLQAYNSTWELQMEWFICL